MTLHERYLQATNRLAKWRLIFAGWQLGTRSENDPECQAVREQFNTMVNLRAEMNALTALCMAKGIFTHDEFEQQIITECDFLQQAYEKKFPGMKATDHGIDVNPTMASETMAGWKR